MQRRTLTRQHRFIGIALLLPFIAWSLTGIFFLVRPGYQEAYEQVPVRQYTLPAAIPVPIDPRWQEVRYFRSILGDHLIVLDSGGWTHLHAETAEPWPLPEPEQLKLLLEDAFQFNSDRYGSVASVTGNTAHTDTDVELTISWTTLSISQNGKDSRWIDRLYSIHYLEWTGFYFTDRILGVGGLVLLLYMTFTGWQMAFRSAGKANSDS